jgi:ABC-2 type transport system ATP-binding protein
MDEAESCDITGFIFNGRIMDIAPPLELMAKNNASDLEDVFIMYVEKATNRKVSATFKEMKFLHGGES